MTETDHDPLRDRLDALSRRIEARAREFKERGAFSGMHETGMDEFRKRSASIKEKLDAAISKGSIWDIIKYEFERDFHSLHDDFALFEERLDAETMKNAGKAGSNGGDRFAKPGFLDDDDADRVQRGAERASDVAGQPQYEIDD